VNFETFRVELEVALSCAGRSYGGRPPYDPVPMFCILVRQAPYTLSDEETGRDTSRPPRSAALRPNHAPRGRGAAWCRP